MWNEKQQLFVGGTSLKFKTTDGRANWRIQGASSDPKEGLLKRWQDTLISVFNEATAKGRKE